MVTISKIQVFDRRTQRSGLEYELTPKHHGTDPGAARWLPELTAEEEFLVFDSADLHDISDERRWLYGVLRIDTEELRFLGTWNQQLAEFPFADEGCAWHGYPLYPLKDQGPENRRGQEGRPSKVVFEKMVQEGLLSKREKKRLMKGDHA